MDANKARSLHRMLDRLEEGQHLDQNEIGSLREALPELPKQKTLEEIAEEVYSAWVAASGYECNGTEYSQKVAVEDWLGDLYTQLDKINKKKHPEFLETEADYENAPEGTIVALDYSLPWRKSFSLWVSIPVSEGENAKGMSDVRRRVLRWGDKE